MNQALNDEFLNKTCQYAKNVFTPCLFNFRDSVKICLPEELIQYFEPQKRLFEDILNYLCSKKADDYNSLIKFKTDQCLKSNIDLVDTCIPESFKKIKRNAPSDPIEVLQTLHQDLCSDFMEFDGCFTRLFDECDDKRPVEFISGLIKAMIETPCKDKNANMIYNYEI